MIMVIDLHLRKKRPQTVTNTIPGRLADLRQFSEARSMVAASEDQLHDKDYNRDFITQQQYLDTWFQAACEPGVNHLGSVGLQAIHMCCAESTETDSVNDPARENLPQPLLSASKTTNLTPALRIPSGGP